jgi:hypothetical protein
MTYFVSFREDVTTKIRLLNALAFYSNQVQSNLCITTNLGTPNLWPLLTGGCCSEVALCYENLNRDSKIVSAAGRWSLFGGGR